MYLLFVRTTEYTVFRKVSTYFYSPNKASICYSRLGGIHKVFDAVYLNCGIKYLTNIFTMLHVRAHINASNAIMNLALSAFNNNLSSTELHFETSWSNVHLCMTKKKFQCYLKRALRCYGGRKACCFCNKGLSHIFTMCPRKIHGT